MKRRASDRTPTPLGWFLVAVIALGAILIVLDMVGIT